MLEYASTSKLSSNRRIQESEVEVGHSCGGRVANGRATLTNPSNLDCTNLRELGQCALVEFGR